MDRDLQVKRLRVLNEVLWRFVLWAERNGRWDFRTRVFPHLLALVYDEEWLLLFASAFEGINAEMKPNQRSWYLTARALASLARAAASAKHYRYAERLFNLSFLIGAGQGGGPGQFRMLLISIVSSVADELIQTESHCAAEGLLTDITRKLTEALGPEHPVLCYPAARMMQLKMRNGLYPAAQTLAEKEIRLVNRPYCAKSPLAAAARGDLGIALSKCGHPAKAELMLKEMLNQIVDLLGPKHKASCRASHALGIMYCDQERFSEAEVLLVRSVSIQTAIVGPYHLATARLLKDLAVLYSYQGRHAEAAEVLERVLSILQRGKEFEDPETAQVTALYRAELEKSIS
jgi:tetratricopeptide (TPR) repeat protein